MRGKRAFLGEFLNDYVYVTFLVSLLNRCDKAAGEMIVSFRHQDFYILLRLLYISNLAEDLLVHDNATTKE